LTALAVAAKARRFQEIPAVDVFVDVFVDVHSSTWASMSTSIRIPQTPEDRLVYTVAEAGELLGISRAFAYELVARGELPVICLGRRRLVPKVALLALVGQTSPEDLSDPR
jgi:excisionase family DNA binding protein